MQQLTYIHSLSRLARHACTKAASSTESQAWLTIHKTAPQAGAEMPESLPKRQRRIIHRARQRGWLELDIVFGAWAARTVPSMQTEAELCTVEDLLTADTPDVLRWVLKQESPPDRFDTSVLHSLRDFASRGSASAVGDG